MTIQDDLYYYFTVTLGKKPGTLDDMGAYLGYKIPSAPPFNDPTDLPTLEGWWDASNVGSVTVVGTKMTQWDDLSGNGNHFVPPNPVDEPTYDGRTLNGLNVFYNDLSAMQNSLTLTQPFSFSCLAIIQYTYRRTIFASLGNNGGGPLELTRVNTPTGGGPWQMYAGAYRDMGSTPYQQEWTILNGTFDGVDSYYSVNGEPLGKLASSPGTNGLEGMRLLTSAGGTGSWRGEFAELILWSGPADATEHTNVTNYLTNKWGL